MTHFSGLSSLLDCHLFWMIISSGLPSLLDYTLLDYHLCWITLCPHLHSHLDYPLIWIALSLSLSWIMLTPGLHSFHISLQLDYNLLEFPPFCIALSSGYLLLWIILPPGLFGLQDHYLARITLFYITLFPGLSFQVDYLLSWNTFSLGL